MLKRKARFNEKGRQSGQKEEKKMQAVKEDDHGHAELLDANFQSKIDPSQFDASNPLIITEEDMERKKEQKATDFTAKRPRLSAKRVKALKKIVLLKLALSDIASITFQGKRR
jgi:hypothetical protein